MEGLVAQGLQKWFKTRKVVDNVSLDIQRGEVVGLLGPNVAGKTTSFYMMVGLDRKSTRLNSSHDQISYAVFCLIKKKYVFSGSFYATPWLGLGPTFPDQPVTFSGSTYEPHPLVVFPAFHLRDRFRCT